MDRALGIDPSTHTGIVVLERKNTVITTIYQDELHFAKLKGMERLGMLATGVLEVVRQYGPQHIGIEGYSYGSKWNHESMYSIGTVLRYFLWQEDWPYLEVAPGSVKKFATGKGNCGKDLVMKEVYKNWGFDTNNDNLSDAYTIALYTMFFNEGVVNEKGVYSKKALRINTFHHPEQEN